jgi:hypothetical protein
LLWLEHIRQTPLLKGLYVSFARIPHRGNHRASGQVGHPFMVPIKTKRSRHWHFLACIFGTRLNRSHHLSMGSSQGS